MKTLFARILIWFWITLLTSVLVSGLISALDEDEFDRSSPISRMLAFEGAEAVPRL